jgi:MYXO-CTERM domain-containing protein
MNVVSRRLRLLGAIALWNGSAAIAADVVASWIGPTSGTTTWSNPANWATSPSVPHFPNNGNGGFTFDATLTSFNANVQLTEPVALQKFTLVSGAIDGPHDFVVNEQMTWIDGGMGGSGTTTIPQGASLHFTGQFRRTLTRTLDNFGVATWSAGGMTGADFLGLGTFNNKPGATFFANAVFAPMGAFGNGTFNNEGLVRKTTGGETRFGGITVVHNTGTIQVNAGTLTIHGTPQATIAGDLIGGTWILDATGSQDGATILLNASAVARIGPAARVELRGAGSGFLGMNLSENHGLFRIGSSRHFTTPGTFTNSGTTVIDRDTALAATGTLTNSGTIDVNGGLIARYTTVSPRTMIESQIVAARNEGNWDQSGITSSSARDDALAVTTLGVLEGTEYQSVHGPGAPFFGTPVDGPMVLVKYTYYGDTDFNGLVDGDDYARIDAGFNLGLTGWFNGDADLSGTVDGDDYALIDAAFNLQSGTLRRAMDFLSGDPGAMDLDHPALRKVHEHFDRFGAAYAAHFLASVPEPSGIVWLSALAGAAHRRRRKPLSFAPRLLGYHAGV